MTMTENRSLSELSDAAREADDRLRGIRAEMTEIHDNAGGAELSDGQQERWANLERGAKKAAAEHEELRTAQHEQLRSYVAANPAAAIAGCHGQDSPTTRARNEHRDAGLRAIDGDRFATDTAKQRGTVLVEGDDGDDFARWAAATADPAYMRAWTSLLVDSERGHLSWTEPERQAFSTAQTLSRAMNIGTPASGGFMVPFSLDPSIILTNDGTLSPMRQIASQATIATDSWNGVASAGVSAEWKTEGAQVTDGSPSDLTQPSIPVHMADAYLTYSFEAEQDIASLVDELRTVMLDAKDRHEGTAWITGSGNGQPKGIVTAVAADSGSVVAPTTAETFAVEDIYKMAASLAPRHQGNASWLANYVLEYTIRQFASGSGPSHAFWADLGAGTPPRLLGKDYRGCSDMDSTFDPTATEAHNYLMAFGDFAKYKIVDRIGTTTEIVPHVMGANGRPTGERGLLMYWRTGADCLDTNAFRLLDIPTTT